MGKALKQALLIETHEKNLMKQIQIKRLTKPNAGKDTQSN